MMKIIKKAMIVNIREHFEDKPRRAREHHLVNQSLLRKLSDKYINGSSKAQYRRKNKVNNN